MGGLSNNGNYFSCSLKSYINCVITTLLEVHSIYTVQDGSNKVLILICVRVFDVIFRHVRWCNECLVGHSSTMQIKNKNRCKLWWFVCFYAWITAVTLLDFGLRFWQPAFVTKAVDRHVVVNKIQDHRFWLTSKDFSVFLSWSPTSVQQMRTAICPDLI